MAGTTSGHSDKDRKGQNSASAHEQSRVLSRRAFIAAGGTSTIAALGGCIGGGGSGGSESDDGPEPPWNTEELADFVDDGTTVSIYAASGTTETWNSLVEIINDEFDAGLEASVFNNGGSEVSQRVIQERESGADEADVITYATDIQAQIWSDGESVAEKYFEFGIDENFWFVDEMPDPRVSSWFVSGYDGRASSVMPVNEDIFEERGLDYPESYNDLFDDQYEGLDMIIPADPVESPFGWIISYHADEADMGNEEWLTQLLDRFELTGVSSHSTGAREIASGNAALMFYNFPSTVSQLVADQPIRGNFVDPVEAKAWSGPLSINTKAPHPWAARLLLSATLEEEVQKRVINEAPEMTPVRDLDYSTVDPDPFTQKRLNTNTVLIEWEEATDIASVGATASEEWLDI